MTSKSWPPFDARDLPVTSLVSYQRVSQHSRPRDGNFTPSTTYSYHASPFLLPSTSFSSTSSFSTLSISSSTSSSLALPPPPLPLPPPPLYSSSTTTNITSTSTTTTPSTATTTSTTTTKATTTTASFAKRMYYDKMLCWISLISVYQNDSCGQINIFNSWPS